MFSLLIVLLLFSNFLFTFNANADQNINNKVDAEITITFKSATDFDVNIECNVEKITLSSSGKTYTNEEIEIISNTDLEKMGAIKYALKTMIYDQLSDVFIGSNINPVDDLLEYQDYRFYDSYSVNLTSSFFDLNENVSAYELVNGVLDIGATVDYDFVFKANPGWNTTYTVQLGQDYTFELTDGKTSGKNIEWKILNGTGENPDGEILLIISSKNPTSRLERESITLDFILEEKNKKTELSANVNLNGINISDYDFLPEFITDIELVPSDGIRLFVKNGFLSWDEIYQKTVKDIEEKIKSNLETSTFNQTLEIEALWDNESTSGCVNPYDVESMDDEPSVISVLKDKDITLLIEQVTSNALFGLVNAGAKASLNEQSIIFGDKLDEIGYDYNITLKMPDGIELDGENDYTWNENKNFSGLIESKKAPKYNQEEIKTEIDLEVKSVDLNLLSFFTGSPKIVLDFFAEEEKNYNVTKIPPEFSLPDKIEIDYLNSDALRICIDENIFKSDQVNTFLDNEKTFFENKLRRVVSGLEVKGNTDKDSFDESLVWNQDINNMDSEQPVKTRTYAYTTHPIGLHLSIIPPSVKIPDQTYNFTGLKNQSVTYKILFPSGITVDVKDKYGKAEVKKTEDERQYLEITFSSEESNMSVDVTCLLTPSTLFVIGLFIPCIISIVITIIILIVVIMLRKKRKGRGPKRQREPVYEERDTGYEDQDYYIPPPPGSK